MKKVKSAQLNVILAAGGNPTGILCFPDSSHRDEYIGLAKKAMTSDPTIEQFGFLEGRNKFHFQMSGGEFCGNAARAVAMLISEATGGTEGGFTMSGFDGRVSFRIIGEDVVECQFPGLQMKITRAKFLDTDGDVVDMGGIVHVVLPFSRPFNGQSVSWYEGIHREITAILGLGSRSAVGVIWREKRDGDVTAIHPVVWVKGIDSFFYETACGSGTLAVLAVSGSNQQDILQPSGQCIHAEKIIDGGTITYSLRSEMQRRERNGAV